MEESVSPKDELGIDKVHESGLVEKYFPKGSLHQIRTIQV